MLGGDHSIAYPDIKGFMSAHDRDDVAVVQFAQEQQRDVHPVRRGPLHPGPGPGELLVVLDVIGDRVTRTPEAVWYSGEHDRLGGHGV